MVLAVARRFYKSGQPIFNSRRKLMSVYTPAITSSSTMPAPSGNRSNLFVGIPWRYRRSEIIENSRPKQSIAEEQEKLATRKPTISSMTMNCGSFCFRILAPSVDSHIAPKIDPTHNRYGKWKVAHGDVVKRERERNGNKSSDGPWGRGKYPTPRRLRKTVRLFGEMYSSRGAPEQARETSVSPSRKQTTLTLTTG